MKAADQSAPRAPRKLEPGTGTGRNVLCKRARPVPVAKPVSIMFRIASDHGSEGEHEDYSNKKYLSTGWPEIGFTMILHYNNIENA